MVDASGAKYPGHARHGWIGLAIAAFLFVSYQANLRGIGAADTVPSTLLPVSLLREGDLDLDEFTELIHGNPAGVLWLGAVQERDGSLWSSYPVGGAFLALPAYLASRVFVPLDAWWQFLLVGKIAASLLVAVSGGIVFSIMRRLVDDGVATMLALAYGLGTSAWPVASQAMWQHGPGMLCLALAILALQRLDERRSVGDAMIAGIAIGGAIACRHLNVLPAGLLSLFVMRRHPHRVLAFGLPAAALVMAHLWYNFATFGTLQGGYAALFTGPALAQFRIPESGEFSYPLFAGLAGHLISPSKGLLVFSPFMAFAVTGAVRAWRRDAWPLARYLVAWVVLMLIVLSKYVVWWGGGSYGPRLLAELSIPLTLLIAHGWATIRASRVAMGAFGLSLAAAIGMQAVGAFFAPCQWGSRPWWVHTHQERLWDWRDPETLRCLADGPKRFEFLDHRRGPS